MSEYLRESHTSYTGASGITVFGSPGTATVALAPRRMSSLGEVKRKLPYRLIGQAADQSSLVVWTELLRWRKK